VAAGPVGTINREDEMSTATLTDFDMHVRDRVLQQLDWDPEVDASGIGVAAKDGVVTLSGYIDTCSGKLAAERAARHVRGVRGVANDLEVRLVLGRTDTDIASDAVRALELRGIVPETVQAIVHNGHVTLTGETRWLYQAREAERAVRHVPGVRGVFNHVGVAAGTFGRERRSTP
jgi:osmotically-inducible protein OsmY